MARTASMVMAPMVFSIASIRARAFCSAAVVLSMGSLVVDLSFCSGRCQAARGIFRRVAAFSGGCAFRSFLPLSLGGAAGGFSIGDGFGLVHGLKSLFFAQKRHSERFRKIRNRSERPGAHSGEVVSDDE